ncbi:hypothetical protein KR009_002942 [Drosophila setifemur]|nr:hypothetical protein KR009_002942 [Drosophila setifemur]
MSSSIRIRPEYPLLVLLLLATLIPLLLADPIPDPIPDPVPEYNPHTESSLAGPEPEAATQARVDGQRIVCKLTFDAATMDSLGCPNKGQLLDGPVNKPGEDGPDEEAEEEQQQMGQEQMQRHLKTPNSQPIYEIQLVVWPTDIEDGDDFSPPLATTTTRGTTSTTSTTTTTTFPPPPAASTIGTPIEQIWPLYEDQLVVFPQMDFEEENLDYFFDDLGPSSTAAPPTPVTGSPTKPSTTTWHPTGTPTPTPIYVVQNYHVIHPNGTEEYKLVMSNGLVNYKKLYTKKVGDQVINVQEGYNSVPIPGPKNQIQTQYYIADERGYNVYKIELHYHQNGLPKHLHYKDTKAGNMGARMSG